MLVRPLKTLLLAGLLPAATAAAQALPACPSPAQPGSSGAWLDAVDHLPLPQQLAAIHQRMRCDTAYRGFQPGMCWMAVGLAAGRTAAASGKMPGPPADARPQGETLLYVVDDYPAAGNTAAAVADFWRRVAARRIRRVTLLRGPLATAIYGSRAASGVVLLSSHKGRRP